LSETEFLIIITPFKDKMFRIARRLLVSAEEAEDALQDVIFKLWRSRDKLTNYKNPEAYAITMIKNRCFDQLKSKNAQNLKIAHSNYEDSSRSLQESVEVNDSLRWVEFHMNALPRNQKLILQLRDVECFEFSEIADILDMNETAIRFSLSRARKIIREKLTKTHNYGIK